MTQRLLEKIKKADIQMVGKSPVVVVPLEAWREMEDIVEEYRMERSPRFLRAIEGARKQIKQGKLYEFNVKTGAFKALRRK